LFKAVKLQESLLSFGSTDSKADDKHFIQSFSLFGHEDDAFNSLHS
jgi:hypothetical protein